MNESDGRVMYCGEGDLRIWKSIRSLTSLSFKDGKKAVLVILRFYLSPKEIKSRTVSAARMTPSPSFINPQCETVLEAFHQYNEVLFP